MEGTPQMADITLSAADILAVKTVKVVEQISLIAGEAISGGMPVYLNTSTGRVYKARGNAAGTAGAIGLCGRTVAAGEACTIIQQGLMDLGTALNAVNYGAVVYLSDTATGILGDAAGTVSVVLGRVVPGQALGNTAERLLRVDL